MDDVFNDMEQYAGVHRVPIIGREGLELLQQAVLESQPRSILEIGTAIGYSTLQIACQAPIGARIVTIEKDPARAETARAFFLRTGRAESIELICADASQLLPMLTGRYDFVFIDAAKGHYLEYLTAIMDKLQPGAVVFADNVLFRGWVKGEDVPRRFRTIVNRLRAYLDFVSNDPRFVTTIYPTGDGVAVSRYQGEKH